MKKSSEGRKCKSAREWAREIKDTLTLKKIFGWKLAYVTSHGSGFELVAVGLQRGRSQTSRDIEEIIGCYTPDISIDHLEEDIQFFMNNKTSRGQIKCA